MRERPPIAEPAKTWLDRVGQFIDRTVHLFNPIAGFNRMLARRDAAVQMSTYEGAAHTEARDNAWLGSRLSETSAQEEDLPALRGRSREMYRNDSIGGAVDNSVNHVVGTGFTPMANIPGEVVGTEAAEVFNKELESIAKRWMRAVDISRRWSLWQQTRLMHRCRRVDGEALAVMSDVGSADSPIPLVIEVIDIERLETPPHLIGSKNCRLGIETDDKGTITHYWIRKTHPGDTVEWDQNYDRVPAKRVLHVFERWFPGQLRGLPWMCRALTRTKDCKDLDEAEILRHQVQTCHAVFVETPGNPALAAAQAAQNTSNGGLLKHEDIRPGAKIYLRPGEKPTMASPSAASGYAPLQEWNYRRIAASINQPFEIFVKNWSGISFAGGRLILAEYKLDCKSEQKLLTEQFLIPIWERMTEEAVILSLCSIEPRFYDRRPWIYNEHVWMPQAWPYAITPAEEIEANTMAVDHNQRTNASVIGENGEDLEFVYLQRKRERELERKYKIEPVEREKIAAAAAADSPGKAKPMAPQKVRQLLEAAA